MSKYNNATEEQKTKMLSGDNTHTVIEAIEKAKTEKAILIPTIDNQDCWLPLSQVEIIDTYDMVHEPKTSWGKMVVLSVPNWLVIKNEII